MEQNIFTAGVAPGGPTTENEIKTLVCYILTNLNEPINFSQLHSALREKDLVNYFEFASAMDSLKESGHLSVVQKGDTEYYQATKLGEETAETLSTSLPKRLKEKGLESARLVLARDIRLQEVKAKITSLETGGFQVNLSIPDLESDLISFSLFAPTKEKAEKIRTGFLNDPTYIYQSVMSLVTGNISLIENIKPKENKLFE